MEFNEGNRRITIENEKELRLAETITHVGFGMSTHDAQIGTCVEAFPVVLSERKSLYVLNGLRQLVPELVSGLDVVTEAQVQEAWHKSDELINDLTLDPA